MISRCVGMALRPKALLVKAFHRAESAADCMERRSRCSPVFSNGLGKVGGR